MPAEGDSLPLRTGARAVFGLGDFTVNTALTSLSLVYASYFLPQVAGLSPTLAGLVPLVARFLDAVTDPLMGRLSDVTPWRAGRRRPYFLLGAVPFGASFALLWWNVPVDSEGAKFAYYTAVYSLMSVSMTVLSVPYLALIPEMALRYDDRTSLNTWRNAGSLLGIFAAIAIRPVAEALGGGPIGFALAGALFGLALALPWLLVYRVSFERPGFRDRARNGPGLVETMRVVLRNPTFRQLTALYLFGRIAMDVISALLILYFTYWLGVSGLFEPFMAAFVGAVMLSLPVWLRISRRFDKSTIFIAGSLWWAACQLLTLFFVPETPAWVMFVYGPLAGVGFAVVDLMPWAMVGEVVDEDELASGERREGVYNGVFTFLRKLAGAVGVFLVLAALDLVGYEKGEVQTEAVRQTIRVLTGTLPVVLLLAGVWMARSYPLTREAHQELLHQLEAREGRHR